MLKPDPGDRPAKIVVINRSPGRLEAVRGMVEKLDTDIVIEYITNADPRMNDEIMASLPDHSIVINATGMGKDTPGSPFIEARLYVVENNIYQAVVYDANLAPLSSNSEVFLTSFQLLQPK